MLVRSGKVAVLVIEGDFLRMTFPVMCLQNGSLGQLVRVLNKETKKTYLAHVTGFLAALVIFLFVRKDLITRYFSGRKI